MYNIIKDGATIATIDNLQYWRTQRNGVNINCLESQANGIIVNNNFYHLPWMPESGNGEEDVTYSEFSGADALNEYDAALSEIEAALGVNV